MKTFIYTLFVFAIFSQTQAQSPIVWQEMLNYKGWDSYNGDSTVLNIKTIELANGDLLLISSGGYGESLIERRDSNNNPIWKTHISYNSAIRDVLEANDGSIYLGGWTQGMFPRIRNVNYSTNTIVTDSLFYAKYNKNNELICNNCTFRSINGVMGTSSSITNASDWNKATSQLVMKLSPNGIVDWIRLFGGNNVLAAGEAIVKADNGNVWIVGREYGVEGDGDIVGSHQPPNQNGFTFDIMAVKVSPTGQKLLAKFYGSSSNEVIQYNNQVISSNDGGFTMVFRSHNSTYNIDGDIADATPSDLNHDFVFKIASDGSITWKKYMSYGEYSYSGGYYTKITRTIDGGYMLIDNAHFYEPDLPVGYHSFWEDNISGYGNWNTTDIRLTKINNVGLEQWHKYYGGIKEEFVNQIGISPTSDGGVVFIAGTQSPDGDIIGWHPSQTPYYKDDYWVVKVDAIGTMQWNRAFGGSGTESLNYLSIFPTQDGKYIFSAGPSWSADGDMTINLRGDVNQTNWLAKFEMPCFVEPPTAVTQNVRVCAGTTINLSATCSAGTTVKWYQDNGTALLANTTIAPTTTTYYRVRCESNTTNCISAFTQTKIWVNDNPVAAVTADKTVCSSEGAVCLTATCSPTAANPYQNSQATWYQNDGVTLIPNNCFTLPSNNITTYKVKCETNDLLRCKSPSTDVTLTKIPIQNAPTLITQSQTICLGSSITLSATCDVGSNVAWYDDYYGSPLTNLTVSPTSYKTYYVRCESGGTLNCKSSPQVINIYINSIIPAAPTATANPISITAGESSILTATDCGGAVKWSLLNSTINPLVVVPNTTTNYTASCIVNACESPASMPVSVTVICPLALVFSPTTNFSSGILIKQANATITATNAITGTAKVTYQAKNIQLNAGFKADNGTVFKAEIGGCL